MKYEVHWHDQEDGRSGSPIEVETDSVEAAFWQAVDQLRAIAPQFIAADVELLKDEDGNLHNPDFFLEDSR